MGSRSGKFKESENKRQSEIRRASDVRRNTRNYDSIDLQATHPHLAEEDYTYLMNQTGKSRSHITSLFHKFSKRSLDGELTHEEFCDFFLSISPNPPEFLRDNSQFVFDSFDYDQNGTVSFKEFLTAYVLLSPGNLEKKIEYTFHLYDIDKNGYLDIDEVYRIVIRVFGLMDKNKANERDSVRFAEDFIKKLDVAPRDGKISKGKF
jgi:Ca2+-binding EF-hand superfamily protein